MSRIQHIVVIFFVVIAVNRIDCASFINEKEINVTRGDLQIRDDSATGNSSLEARSKRWTEESIETPSESDSISYPDHQTYIFHRSRRSVHGGRRHRHHAVWHNGLHLTEVFMPTRKKANISVHIQLRHWERGRETLRVNLDPNGTTGYDAEFDLVADVVRSTKKHKQFSDYDFIKIEKIVNGGFWKKYRKAQNHIKSEVGFINERMLFHGTSKAEYILKAGFDERYASIGGNMFGAGLYFAEHSSKSNGYAFGNGNGCPVHYDRNCDKCERQMILCRVALGRMQNETVAKPIAHPDPGYNSLKGVVSPGGLKYPEYIVYKGEQVYPEYLITYKIVI